MIPVSEIVEAVKSVVDRGPPRYASNLHLPDIGEQEALAVAQTVRTEAVGYGALDQFQAQVAQVCGTEQALCVSSGTAALHLALMLCKVEPYTEVLVPALTFVATANAVCYCGAIPNFVDVRSTDYGVNPFKLSRYLGRIAEKRDNGTFNRQTGKRISALIVVDLLGVPAGMDELKAEAGRWGLPVIEDAAEALGSAYKGHPCGSGAYVGIISFNNNKLVTTNGGGALLTNDVYAQAQAWELATTARLGHPWLMGNHTRVAWNYRMSNIGAALGLPQLERLDQLLQWKRKLHEAYAQRLNIVLEHQLDEGSRWNYWLNHLTLPPLDHRRDEICAALIAEGIACRTLFTPLHHLPMFAKNPRDNLDVAVEIWRRTICLPSSPAIGAAL